MQQIGGKKLISRLREGKPEEKMLSLSSFSLVHRFGNVEIVNVKPVKTVQKEQYFAISHFPGWCMPEQIIGYIKCRKHDFL